MKQNSKPYLLIGLVILAAISTALGVRFYKLQNTKTVVHQASFELKTKIGENEWAGTGINEKNIKKVEIINDNTLGIRIGITLNTEGAKIFEKVTTENVGKQIAIFVDDTIISAPTVSEAITNGEMVITGNFTQKDALNFKARLLGYYYINSKEYKNLEALNREKNADNTLAPIIDGIEEVKASHLLICYKVAIRCDNNLTRDEALQKIRDIKKQVTSQNFSALVKKYSDEPGAKDSGGDLGWFKHGVMVEQFEKVVFLQPVGTISNIVETEFGFHLIYKQDEKRSEN